MTWRAALIGVALGLAIASLEYANLFIARQPALISNLFPVSVFGVVVGLLILVSPLLGRIGRAFAPAELALIAALALAVCGWPGSGFFRYFSPMLVAPSQQVRNKTNWQAQNVMSYLPGGSARLAEGFVLDWVGFCRSIVRDKDQPDTPAAGVWRLLADDGQRAIGRVAHDGRLQRKDAKPILRALNDLIAAADLHHHPAFARVALPGPGRELAARAGPLAPAERERLNRYVLTAAFPEHLLPPPEGQGVLLSGGRSDPGVTDLMYRGAGPPATPADEGWIARLGRRVTDVPWRAWWPALRFWGALALAVALACLCVVLVVHPQWSRNELLAYPIPRFLDEVTQRAPGRLLPDMARSRLFWWGLGAMLAVHAINVCRLWDPRSPLYIPQRFDFAALKALFPGVEEVQGQAQLFAPTFYPTVVAFAFFLTTEVSLSVGVSLVLWVMLGATLVSWRVTLHGRFVENSQQNLLIFGACVGLALTVLYTGRRHYWDVLRGAVGLPRSSATPGYSVWAARLLLPAIAAAVLVLASVGLSWGLGLALVALVLLSYLVITRVNAETGVLLVQPRWIPAAVLTAFLGFETVGPTNFLLMSIVTVVLLIDPRETLMAQVANALKIGEQTGGVAPRRLAGPLAAMAVVGFGVALVATLSVQQVHGINPHDAWGREGAPQFPFDRLAQNLSNVASVEQFQQMNALSDLGRLNPFQWRVMEGVLPWAGAGLALFLGCAWARLRLPWFPLHPVLFVIWGTYPCFHFAWSFLLGWAVKTAVVRLGGTRTYHQVKPLMVGVIAGELLAGLAIIAIGGSYYLLKGVAPPPYHLLP